MFFTAPAGEGFDAEFLQFTEDPGVAPAGVLREFQNQLLDLLELEMF